MVIVDTSVIIDHLRRAAADSSLVKFFEANSDQRLAISVVTIQELYEGKSTRDEVKEGSLLAVLGLFEVLGYNAEIATEAGKIARDMVGEIDFADAVIAATAIMNKADVWTLNKKHFEGIPGIELYPI